MKFVRVAMVLFVSSLGIAQALPSLTPREKLQLAGAKYRSEQAHKSGIERTEATSADSNKEVLKKKILIGHGLDPTKYQINETTMVPEMIKKKN